MIFGIGHDIVENERIKRLYDRYGNSFLSKILSFYEINVFKNQNKSINYLAKRFAAKEAFAKACGTGIRTPILFTAITVDNDVLGKPFFSFDKAINNWFSKYNIHNVYLSLSDENKLSSAFVVLETCKQQNEECI